jgi:hypothetical protein
MGPLSSASVTKKSPAAVRATVSGTTMPVAKTETAAKTAVAHNAAASNAASTRDRSLMFPPSSLRSDRGRASRRFGRYAHRGHCSPNSAWKLGAILQLLESRSSRVGAAYSPTRTVEEDESPHR